MTVEVCEPLQMLKSVKAEWMWNRKYQEIYKRAKLLVKEDTCMRYYDVRKPLYLETDASGVSMGIVLVKVRDNLNCRCDKVPDNVMIWPLAFVNKSLFSVVQQYRNIEREEPRIWHGLEKFHHHCFAHELHVITDHKLFVAMMG